MKPAGECGAWARGAPEGTHIRAPLSVAASPRPPFPPFPAPLDPASLPERIEEVMEPASPSAPARCVAFNRYGTLLAGEKERG